MELINTVQNLVRYKTTTPFSRRLNAYINDEFEKIKHLVRFSEIDTLAGIKPEDGCKKLMEQMTLDGYITVYTGFSDETIFGDPIVNHKFRALHDLDHIALWQDFTEVGERIVGLHQINKLPDDWEFERELLYADVIGQIEYHKEHNDFPVNQRLFVINYITTKLTKPLVPLSECGATEIANIALNFDLPKDLTGIYKGEFGQPYKFVGGYKFILPLSRGHEKRNRFTSI